MIQYRSLHETNLSGVPLLMIPNRPRNTLNNTFQLPRLLRDGIVLVVGALVDEGDGVRRER